MAPNNWEVMNVERAMHFFSKRFGKAIRLAGEDDASGMTPMGQTITWE